ncbi:hypothetical protein V3595_13055 [Bacillus sp. CFBP9009]
MYIVLTFHQDNWTQFGKEAEIILHNIGFHIGSIVHTKYKITVQEGVYMPNEKNNPAQQKSQVSRLNEVMEVDTDVNEDPNREKLLDDSVDSFLKSKKEQEY